ncbi:MAG: hypothetical protein F6K65_26355 [Moorea sp. SIO3C2]|nr:hypothetical protein [Moorena sp. SIO3C2]
MGYHSNERHRIFSRLPTPDSRFPIPDSRFPFPSWEGLGVGSDSRFPIPDSRLPTPCSLLPTPINPRANYLTQLRTALY